MSIFPFLIRFPIFSFPGDRRRRPGGRLTSATIPFRAPFSSSFPVPSQYRKKVALLCAVFIFETLSGWDRCGDLISPPLFDFFFRFSSYVERCVFFRCFEIRPQRGKGELDAVIWLFAPFCLRFPPVLVQPKEAFLRFDFRTVKETVKKLGWGAYLLAPFVFAACFPVRTKEAFLRRFGFRNLNG